MTKEQKPNKEFFDKLKEELKNEEFVRSIFDVYGLPIDTLDDIHMSFDDDLDVSAKTKGDKMYFNTQLLEEDSTFKEHKHYLIHELIHCLDVITHNIDHEENEKEDYLENQNELDAFQVQILYKLVNDGPKEVIRYVEQVLDHHDVKDYEKEDKARDLMGDEVYEAI